MKKSRYFSLLMALMCVIYLAIPALASPYSTPASSSTSPYSTQNGSGSSPYTTPSTTGKSPYNSWTMPGSGSNFGVGSSGYMPGSGTSGAGGTTSGSSGNTSVGFGSISGSSGNFGGGGSNGNSGDHFGAYFNDDGSIEFKLPGATGVTEGDPSSAIATIFQKYKKIGVVIIGICIITAIICLLFQITKLGAAGDNERMRASALKGIIICGAVIAAFGALTIIVGIFWNALV